MCSTGISLFVKTAFPSPSLLPSAGCREDVLIASKVACGS